MTEQEKADAFPAVAEALLLERSLQDHMLTRGCRTLLMHMPVGITRIESKILVLQPVSKQH